ncbi:MAG: ATP-binding protein, partial [Sulfurimonas sp.]|nr:ATP-binding protein [Sulfurimonas sp.]
YASLPDVAAIYEGDYPEIKNQPALLYALVSALVEYYKCSDTHKKHLLAFAQTLPTEFAVMLIKDVIVKDETLAEFPAFEEWLEKYGDYIF